MLVNDNQNFQVQQADPNFSSAVPPAQENISIPKVDIIEERESISYIFELPGIKEESLNVAIEQDNLLVNARVNNMNGNYNFLHQERPKGKFNREIEIPPNINQSKTMADYNNGILKIKFAKNT